MQRFVNVTLASLALSCAKLAGLDDFAVAPPDDGASQVAAFLGGAECGECVAQTCAPAVDACVSDRGCAEPAECMAGCADTPWHGTDPACVVTKCRGATFPTNTSLEALSDCARNRCPDPCEVGKSWGCVHQYAFPPPPSEFDVSFQFEKWNDNWDPSTHLEGATVDLCNDRGEQVAPGAPFLACPNSLLSEVGTTDGQAL